MSSEPASELVFVRSTPSEGIGTPMTTPGAEEYISRHAVYEEGETDD
jgi:hypothetical protein